jgi:hypothetical protein
MTAPPGSHLQREGACLRREGAAAGRARAALLARPRTTRSRGRTIGWAQQNGRGWRLGVERRMLSPRSAGVPAMPIHVDAYTVEGVASGVLARSGYLRDALEIAGDLPLERVVWLAIDAAAARPAGAVTLPVDDVLIAVADDDPSIPVHASWHALRLEVGPYIVEGEMPTLPGYDPGRALTRPSGEFVMLRDVRLARLGDPEGAVPLAHHALINRYAVDRVEADIMLGFYFPGAVMGIPTKAAVPS